MGAGMGMQVRRSSIWVWVALAPVVAGPALALEPLKNEWDTLQACEKSVCDIILNKVAKGKNPDCNITKTWAKSTIKQGESKAVTWSFGDTRCQAKLDVDRGQIIAALTQPKYTYFVPTQTVKCVIEQDGELKPITAKAAPKLKFKNGKADKIWINLEKIEGPDNVTGTISTIAAMEDKLGIFHSSLIKSVNKFIHKRCAQKYGPDAKTAEAEPEADAKAAAKPKAAKEKPAAAPAPADAKPDTAKAKAAP